MILVVEVKDSSGYLLATFFVKETESITIKSIQE